jgi:hypothetical protein
MRAEVAGSQTSPMAEKRSSGLEGQPIAPLSRRLPNVVYYIQRGLNIHV